MTLGQADIVLDRGQWHILRRPGPDLARLLVGRPVADAAGLLPRLFNLCRTAQSQAVRLSLGLPDAPQDLPQDHALDIIRDHLAHLFVLLPRALGLAPAIPPLPQDRKALFGPLARLPDADPVGWSQGDGPLQRLFRHIARLFPQERWHLPRLPVPKGLLPGPFENSPAGCQANHPLLCALQPGPLWRFVGRLCDLEAALDDRLDPPQRLKDGTAIVRAARGSYALRLTQTDGLISGLARLTPTDHQLALGGALESALAHVPADRPDLARALVALHDPCIPVTLPQVQDA